MELNSVLTLCITALIVTYGMYLTVTTVVRSYFDSRKWDIRGQGADKVLQLRLQAYERMCLFLERISPDNLVMRNVDRAENVIQLQQLLLHEIREEFNHNLAQQIYISQDTWTVIRHAVGEVQTLVNQSAAAVDPDEQPNLLGKKIFENVMIQNSEPTARALQLLKSEAGTLL